MLKRYWFFGLTGLALAGCGDEAESAGVSGELGHGSFLYVCVDSSDPTCAAGEVADRFPSAVGLSGSFDLDFDFDGSSTARVRVVPAAPGIVEETNDQFFAVENGIVAMVAKRTSDGRVLDFFHMEVADIVSLRIDSIPGAPTLVWETGTTETLRAVPLGSDRAVLAGARDFEWATSEPSIVRLERGNPTRQMQLMPLAAGKATISVATGGVETSIEVTVERGENPPPDAGPPRRDAGADASDAGGRDSGDGGAFEADAAGDAGAVTPIEAGADGAAISDSGAADASMPTSDAGAVDGGGDQ